MSDNSMPPLRGTLVVLVFLATATIEVVSSPPGASPLVAVGAALGLTALAAAVGHFARPRASGALARLGFFVLLGAMLFPWPMEMLRRAAGFDPRAVEILLVQALRNATLALASMSAWPDPPGFRPGLPLRLTGLTSLFLVLFAVGMADEQPLLLWLMAGYVCVGTYWLVQLHWISMRQACVDRHGAIPRLPWPALLGTFLLLGVFLAAGAAGPSRAARVLMELMPTSGGTGDYDPAARGGVNDGDDEISGENAKSAGFIETDMFVEDDKPSLYDAISDQYGEPFKPKEQDRTIAIDSRKMSAERNPSENLAARREFPTTRRKPANARRPADRITDALFFVIGRTPLHLRMAVYERFDGVTWHAAPAMNMACHLDGEPDGSWMYLAEQHRPDFSGGSESHELRFARLKSERFPTPPHLFAFRLGKVNRIGFFAWAHPGVLQIRRNAIPPGVSLRTESRVPAPERLAEIEFPPAVIHALGSPDAAVRELARRWAGDAPHGWRQIENVVAALRRHAIHDREATLPAGCTDAVGHFLVHARRGPDYLFASALAVQLRHLGYVTRLVSGFYVRPDRFDTATRQTPVRVEDVHFWTEVLAPGGDWVVLEPTPGYEVLAPRPGLVARLLGAVKALAAWLADRAVGVACLVCLAGVLFFFRRRLLDGLGVLLWQRRAPRCWRAATLGALWLLERRSRWAGRPRPAGCAPVRWSRAILSGGAGELFQIADLADWAAHAPAAHGPPCPAEEAVALCRRALRKWTVRRFREVARERLSPPMASGSSSDGATAVSAAEGRACPQRMSDLHG